ncbi:MAG: amidohydrolase family protein [Labilithrix sp.]|nr:amidohydrolase family protein [Labilithrix sp.]MCW5809978.1 amidohydrolase family protein [Labilithrix sp.]
MRLRSLCAAGPVAALLLFVACSDQVNPSGVKVPPGEIDGGRPTTEKTENPDGTATKHLCKVAKKGDAQKLITGTLLLPAGPAEGELLIDDKGIIACAAPDCAEAPGYDDATRIDCTEVVISPGLINAHDHISFANNPPLPASEERYEHRHDWRKGKRSHTPIPQNAPKFENAVEAAELRFIMSGVTSTASGGGAGSGADRFLRNIDSNAKQTESLPITLAVSDTFPLGDSGGALSKTCAGFSSSRKKATDIASMKGYLPHIAEGIDEEAHAEFTCQSDGVNDLIQRQTAVVHGVAVTPEDVKKYRDDLSILIWSPRSNVSLYGNTAPIGLYARLGVPIALGTDWLLSGSLNMARELKCADDLNKNYFDGVLTDRQLWQSVTANAAYATGTHGVIGELKAGLVADVVIFDASHDAKEYRAVIEAGVEDTILVLRGGKTLYGDSELLSEIGDDDCEALAVCRITKRACVSKDTDGKKTLADLEKVGRELYPLFTCKDETPKNEPSCEPVRGPTATDPNASVYAGITAGDKDGDGVPDADDNCPSTFNPIRPMDGGKQGDADGDGVGDACDRCPLESGESCTPPDADDMDGDGVPNHADNCVEDPNPDQADGDGDGKGAVCDACDDQPNPGDMACTYTVSMTQIRNPAAVGHPPPGKSRVIVKGLVVTAVKTKGSPMGFQVQDPNVNEWGGLFAATFGTAPTVKVGNVVDLEGDYTEFQGTQSQIENPKVTIVDAATSLPFGPITVAPSVYVVNASVDAEKLEGMLCQINGPIAVTVQNSDAPQDFDEFGIGDLKLRVDDFLWDELDNTFPLGHEFSKVVGICSFSHANRKIWPRSKDDLPDAP